MEVTTIARFLVDIAITDGGFEATPMLTVAARQLVRAYADMDLFQFLKLTDNDEGDPAEEAELFDEALAGEASRIFDAYRNELAASIATFDKQKSTTGTKHLSKRAQRLKDSGIAWPSANRRRGT